MDQEHETMLIETISLLANQVKIMVDGNVKMVKIIELLTERIEKLETKNFWIS
jgi:hypothetical protein